VDGWTIYESDGSVWAAKEFGGGGGAPADSVLAPIAIAVTDEVTTIEGAVPAITFRMPDDFTLVSVFASLTEESSSGDVQVDINLTGTGSILTTEITIDATEKTSLTAVTPVVINITAFSQDDELTIDIDSAGTGAKGLKVYLIGVYSNTFPSYSSSEVAQGINWRDGEPIYRKTVACTLPNNNTTTNAHGAAGIDKIIKLEGRYIDAGADTHPLPRVAVGSILTDMIGLFADTTNIYLRSSGNHTGGSNCYIDIYYTKT
jgi:hypothetical protein